MSESGKAVRELLAALTEAVGRTMTPEQSRRALEVRATAGGAGARRVVRDLIRAGALMMRERDALALQVKMLEAALLAQPQLPDPPAGHRWTTAPADHPRGGRLYCATCSSRDGVVLGLVLAAECLERAAAADEVSDAPCSACGVVHP